KICSTCFLVSDFTGLPALTITAMPSYATIVGFILMPLAEAAPISDDLARRLDIPSCAVPSMIAAIPVVEPSAAMSKVVPGCCALNCSANCGTSFAPRVSEPLITIASPRATASAEMPTKTVTNNFFIRSRLLDWNKANLVDDFLPDRTQGEINERLRDPAWFTISIIKGRTPVGIRVILHALNRRARTIYRDHFHSTSFGIGHAHIADTGRIPTYFRRNLLVTGHLLRSRGVVTLFHRK